ncbi:MAG: multifunctional oxoglutarate decarboxylase/oxoglutarate dehydrogenase thiamine pyrophosphate-binding subunit/dihydrolipoyllysine-residue succinyltransferase subunit [Gemmatimonadales bacterium]|nr:multifunctional oxoglutarate decarboxylase/oxoglutarate dehydrogenase thiamine pyrophosphate-binding subunit/dihydrolipoyllysine-residue succinyltransferase subunit [Gemmatimonadales bacterium]
MRELVVAAIDPEQPEFGIPAEAVYTALLEAQSAVPFEAVPATNGSGPAAVAPPSPPAPPVPEGAVQLKGPPLRLAQNMDASLSMPTATTFRELPVQVLEARRAEINGVLKASGRSEKLSFTHLIAWALVRASREFPVMGTSVLHSGGNTYRIDPTHLNLGLAVDVERKDGSRGLVVPVLKQADTMDFAAFLAAYETIVDKARNNRLMPDDFAGATMTLTNPGGLGTVGSVPRLMMGQGTIFATGAIAFPPAFATADKAAMRKLGISKVMMLTSTYDHRVIQGAESGSFLRLVDQLLRGEEGFYEEVADAIGVTLGAAPATTSPAAPTVPVPLTPGSAVATTAQVDAVAAAMMLVNAYRTHGHLAASLDPLGTDPVGDPALDPASVGLTPEVMAAIPAAPLRVGVPGNTLAEALANLRATYCGTIAYEVEHISSHERRAWLREQIESGAHRAQLDAEDKKAVLARLTQVEGLERFLGKAYLGQKRFSIEGVDMMVPMLDRTFEIASDAGVRDVVLGMAHRGRLNVLSHTVGRPYETLFAEFEGARHESQASAPDGGTGDVKYHAGAQGAYMTRNGKSLGVALLPNPSHLEFVGPVVDGRARALQTNRRGRDAHFDPSIALPIVIHGDAAFPGQGVVAETLNLGGLNGYRTGGTVHLIANNQVGFTTDPGEARSTRYASDLAKGFDIPIIHVNADDPEACLSAIELAMAYRITFQDDVVIDLVGYRRHGHNEGDEPAYTQPTMYSRIRDLPTVRQRYATALEAEGTIAAGEGDAMAEATYQHFVETQTSFKASLASNRPREETPREPGPVEYTDTAVDAETLTALNEQLLAFPAGFAVHPKLGRQLERRRGSLHDEHGIEWGHAEALAFASLLVEGTPLRLTGQDVERGTFSHRHLMLHDVNTNAQWAPLQSLPGAQAPIEAYNSPLSELAAIGFEYGYATAAPEALVLWEAQFGDFVNGAQVMLDQFMAAGYSKWGVTSRLTLLLPHGYEGQGPEHSSGRVERFLQSAAEGNMRVVNCSTSAQYFHVLRRQARWSMQRPLVIMTPKSLLRLPAASSSLDDLAHGRFHTVIDDKRSDDDAAKAKTMVFCSGKIYYDLMEQAGEGAVPVVRVEQLYPFPEQELRELLVRYPTVTDVVWAQEEPRNMGGWTFVEPRLRATLADGVQLRYIGRPERASPAEGYPGAHKAEQSRIVSEAMGG